MIWRRLGLFALWVLSIVCISFYGGFISYGFFFTVTLLPIVSYVYLFIVSRSFYIYQELASRVIECGQMTDYYFILQNDMPFSYPGIRVVMFPDFFDVVDMPQNIEYELQPNEKVCFRTKLSCKYRGEYKIGVSSVIMTDYLHIFRWRYKLLTTYEAIVVPRLVHMDALAALEVIEAQMARESKQGTTYADVVVRDYMPGDSMRLIHWKASAKTGSLKVRNYYDESKQGVRLYLELKKYSMEPKEFLPLENKMLEVALAVTAFFTYRNQPVRVCYGTKNETENDHVLDPRVFEGFYEKMSKIHFTTDVDTDKAILRFAEDTIINPSNMVFMVVHNISDELLNQTQTMMDLGMYVVIYVIANEENPGYAIGSNDRRQIIRIGTEDDIKQVL